MEITSNYMLFIFALLLVVINAFTTRETMLYPVFSARKKAFIIALIWLVPIIGLIIAYKLLHLNPSVDTSDGGDGTQFNPGGSINDD